MAKNFTTELNSIFYPESIAVIGASNRFAKWGSFIMSHLLAGGYQGRIYPINPKEKEIYGRKVYTKLAAVPENVDLVVITTPVDSILDITRQCIDKRVGGIVTVTSGFSETGADGKQIEKDLADLVNAAKIPMIGPNTMGVMCTQKKMFALGAPLAPRRGDISFISQSGNLGVQMLEWAEQQGIGMSKFVGSGNESVIRKDHILEYYADDPDTKVILIYLEGVAEGTRFMKIAEETAAKKPIIALKGGRTEAGGEAARSHTGSMAGNTVILGSAFRQSGVIEAKTPSDMLNFSVAMANLPLPKGLRIGVITFGGGWGVITCDAIVEQGMQVAVLSQDIIEKLDKVLPPFWSRRNPVDLVGQINQEAFVESVKLVTSSPDVDAVICLGIVGVTSMGIRSFSASAEAADLDNVEYAVRKARDKLFTIERGYLNEVNEIMNQTHKPVINVSLYAGGSHERYQSKTGYSEVVYPTPETAVNSLAAMYHHYQYLKGKGTME
ncbi:MAG: CoA-binding protein [Deltaproteobacteria bacterium]|nr:CoA-binding protein [Candidatus Zymogenaceae bacterium]